MVDLGQGALLRRKRGDHPKLRGLCDRLGELWYQDVSKSDYEENRKSQGEQVGRHLHIPRDAFWKYKAASVNSPLMR